MRQVWRTKDDAAGLWALAKRVARLTCDTVAERRRGQAVEEIHAMVAADGLPISLMLSEGQADDGHSAFTMLDSLSPGSIQLASIRIWLRANESVT